MQHAIACKKFLYNMPKKLGEKVILTESDTCRLPQNVHDIIYAEYACLQLQMKYCVVKFGSSKSLRQHKKIISTYVYTTIYNIWSDN